MPLSSGYNQQAFHPRGSVASQWGPRGPHQAQFSAYDYLQRGPNPSQNSLYPPQAYGQYPPQQAPRNSYGPSWEQRPPATMQGPSPQVGSLVIISFVRLPDIHTNVLRSVFWHISLTDQLWTANSLLSNTCTTLWSSWVQ